MPDLRTRIADILDDFGLHNIGNREQAAEATLEAVWAELDGDTDA